MDSKAKYKQPTQDDPKEVGDVHPISEVPLTTSNAESDKIQDPKCIGAWLYNMNLSYSDLGIIRWNPSDNEDVLSGKFTISPWVKEYSKKDEPFIPANEHNAVRKSITRCDNHCKLCEAIGGNSKRTPYAGCKKIKNIINREPNEKEQYTVEFLLELDTHKRLVRFSKDNIKPSVFTVVTTQLQNMVSLKYAGYAVGSAAQLHGFVKEVSTYDEVFPLTEIGSTIGFYRHNEVPTNAEQGRVKFFNGDIVIDPKLETDLETCWRGLLLVKEFRQILLCSVMGMGAAYLGRRIVPVVNICGADVNPDLIKQIILSPFGIPEDGYRDIFYKDRKKSGLAFDQDIIPVVVDLITNDKTSLGFEWSGNGYYIDGIGQCYAPLFVISKTPYFKHTHIHIPMDKGFLDNSPEYREIAERSWYSSLHEMLYTVREQLVSTAGQLSCYIGTNLCSRTKFAVEFREELISALEEQGFPYTNEAVDNINVLAEKMIDVISSVFELDEMKWDINWQGVVANAHQQGEKLYQLICNHIKQHPNSVSESATLYIHKDSIDIDSNDHIGFYRKDNNKVFLHIQQGAFSNLCKSIGLTKENRSTIMDYWLEELKMKNSPKGSGRDDSHFYTNRKYVGTKKEHRPFFHVFCLTDLNKEYPHVEVPLKGIQYYEA